MSHTALAAVALVLCTVGVVGVVVPVLPGSLLVAVGLVVWAVGVRTTLAWVVLAVALALVATGSAAGMVLTRRRLARREVPQWPVLVALGGGIVGAVTLPGPGLLLGFVGVLVLVELVRVRRLKPALTTAWTATKAVGLGILVELGCDLAATSVLVVGITLAGR